MVLHFDKLRVLSLLMEAAFFTSSCATGLGAVEASNRLLPAARAD